MAEITGGSQYVAYGKTHYERNKQAYIQKTKERQLRNLKFLNDLRKQSQCIDCGESDYRVLDFDHLPEFKKEKNVYDGARHGWSIEKLQKEIAKCEVRCANCHRIKTWERRNAGVM